MSLSRIEANDDAAIRRRAEYVVLTLLHVSDAVRCDDIDERVACIHRHLVEDGTGSPFHFCIGGSNGPESPELNESIERLLRYGKIDRAEDSRYELIEGGHRYLEDETQLDLDRIDDDFRTSVSDALEVC